MQSTEHYYQSRKFGQPGNPEAQAARDAIVAAATPAEAFALSRVHAALARHDWDLHRKRDMFRSDWQLQFYSILSNWAIAKCN